jgi:hypothetical protein
MFNDLRILLAHVAKESGNPHGPKQKLKIGERFEISSAELRSPKPSKTEKFLKNGTQKVLGSKRVNV